MILLRTHSNRWVARARRTSAVLGLITLVEEQPRPVFTTVRLDLESGERVLLRDTETLEEAFAVLLAGIERARLAAESDRDEEPEPEPEPHEEQEPDDSPLDPLEDSVAA